ncbi:16S rRNA (guanine(966)-N(2))-methyltransferase RsmD [Lysobacter enzymogenes]|uniref:16S rRNA (guanine(966)-N(2))-methyltransferase RsmD n=1 Tax=Lysobacter enzymogenes TaxID=69 RepID=UPI0008977F26|nr:16S rRNA (guanine(966)-N(2))-methyltransferase RsmD [Lysobacter enzymogenes]SDW96985.1 16S rRNA (guanine966-N2)-methyltransferase [Lysobacter enzymogenes]
MSKRGRSGARTPAHPAAASSGRGGNAPGRGQAGKVRIIGGRWRGTRLNVGDAPGLRPTSDRVRETLFNWLQPMLPGARALDLFAGSGALGMEALSRGAASAVLVERDPALAAELRALAARLPGGEAAQVVQADALAWLAQPPLADAPGFDLAFVDPPFAAGLWDAVWPALLPRLAPSAWLYVEAPLDAPLALPAAWIAHREGSTREVRYALYRRAG